MTRELTTVLFDRKKRLRKAGKAAVEIRINLCKTCRKYIQYTTCTRAEWTQVEHSKELKAEVKRLNDIANAMILLNEELTMENLNKRLGLKSKVLGARVNKEVKEEIEEDKMLTSKTSFLDFFELCVNSADYAAGTRRRKKVIYDSLKDFKKIKRFEDLTPKNIMAYHEWLCEGDRTLVTINNYHKSIHQYCIKAMKKGYLNNDPYIQCEIPKGTCKMRKPLNEDELMKVFHYNLEGTEEKIRDLFIFSAYTGMAYSDVMLFRYKKMTEEYKDQVFIDGRRLKTGTDFYTPILPHAMEILQKYNYELPYYTNEFINRTLKEIRKKCMIKKPMTFHIARHSFATLCLTHDVPIADVAKMLGHKDIRTTQIYAKILPETVSRHTRSLIDKLR